MRRLGIGLFIASLVTLPATSWSQTPAGPEFRVNIYTTGAQLVGQAAADANGGVVVVWDSHGQDGNQAGVFGRRFDPAGAPLGGEFQVNTTTVGLQWGQVVCSGAKGRFVIAWEGPDDNDIDVFIRRYDSQGAPLGPETRVNTYTTGAQGGPAVACTLDGAFVVVWVSDQVLSQATSVFGQRFDAAGTRRGGEFRVNTSAAAYQYHVAPSVAVTPAGGFVVAWGSFEQATPYGNVLGRRFDAAGIPLGSEFRVNSYTTGFAGTIQSGAVAPAADGGFVVSWIALQPGEGGDVFARVYDSAGAPMTGEILVNTYTSGPQEIAGLDADERGNFVVTWRRQAQDGYEIFAQRFRRDGVKRGQEFQVNAYTTGRQDAPTVASDRAGNFVVLWSSMGQDGSSYGQYGRRYGGLVPAAMAVDAAGNGVLEIGESVVVAPSWRNVNGGALTFTGTAAGLTGPAGATYTLTDATASYGTVPSGATQGCGGDCYGVSITAPSRPALHWDATLAESILPDALGNGLPWALHLGGSFSDVGLASPFYKFVETALHRGITGGCGGTAYCPFASTTREQMAVFVLVAREGAGYLPPPCTSQMFGDVPPSSPFCPWIQELVRRGVVSGCGGGNFCPGAPVSREQMAVFTLATKEGPGYVPPPCTAPPFADVPVSSPFCRWIQELANRGIVSGCGGGNYCPAAAVPRDQMSVFVTLPFGLTLYGP